MYACTNPDWRPIDYGLWDLNLGSCMLKLMQKFRNFYGCKNETDPNVAMSLIGFGVENW